MKSLELQIAYFIRAVSIPADLTQVLAPRKLAETAASLGLTVVILI
ncbi:hypothetical protein [Paenibacillus durus]|nr:hypothetical protein [Paenibacillus durus]